MIEPEPYTVQTMELTCEGIGRLVIETFHYSQGQWTQTVVFYAHDKGNSERYEVDVISFMQMLRDFFEER